MRTPRCYCVRSWGARRVIEAAASKRSSAAVASLIVFAQGCAAPITQVGSVTQEQIAVEQLKQQQLVIQSSFEQQQRLSDVAGPLLQAAAPICGDAVALRMGIRAMNRPAFPQAYREPARALGFSDTLQLVGVDRGSPAERAGLLMGDRVLSVNGEPLPLGDGAAAAFSDRARRSTGRVALSVLRDSAVRTAFVQRDTVCDYEVTTVRNDTLNAVSDGKRVVVFSSMMRFVGDDDELAAVVGHEIAHNAMHHIDSKMKNALMAGFFGLLLDVAAATQGLNTQGSYTREFAAAGAMVFSQDFEREADYVGINIMAAAGRNPAAAARLWRRMAQESPGSIKLATTHPTTAERFVRLDQYQKEIATRLAGGQPLRLALKNGQQSAPLYAVHSVPADVTMAHRTVAAGPEPNLGVAKTTTAPAKVVGSESRGDSRTALTGTSSRSDRGQSQIAANAATGTTPRPTGRVPQSDDRVALAVIGAPLSDSAEAAAVEAFAVGKNFVDRHDWSLAEEWLKKALRLDGSVAEYHATLGEVEMVLAKWEEAEAEYTAASLIDVGNAQYRAQILEARRRKKR